MKDKRIAIIVCYFGKLPNYFELFLKSCSYNSDIDFLFYTDQDLNRYVIPKNFNIIKYSFEKFKELIQSKFDFPIMLKSPYKICDFRPAFGYIFSEYLKGYDFWGHCDVDMIFGDIVKFLPSNLNEYDKIYHWGHLTIYRNSFDINFLFKSNPYYIEVFSNDVSYIFDEVNGIDKIFTNACRTKYNSRDNVDISTRFYKMKRGKAPDMSTSEYKEINHRHQIFVWESGHVYMYYYNKDTETILKKEFNYIHFQKRKMDIFFNHAVERFAIVSNGFVELNENISYSIIKALNKTNLIKEIGYRCKNYKNRFEAKINRIISKGK